MPKMPTENEDEFTSGLDELQAALAALRPPIFKGRIANVRDHNEVERALGEIDAAIDARLGPWLHNPAVCQLAETTKEQSRERVLSEIEELKQKAAEDSKSGHHPHPHPPPKPPEGGSEGSGGACSCPDPSGGSPLNGPPGRPLGSSGSW